MISVNRRPLTTLAATALVFLLAGPAAAGAGAPADTGRLAYAKIEFGAGAHLFLANADGTDEAPIPLGDVAEDFAVPVWSPDRSRLLISNMIVFDDQGEILRFRPATVNPDGSDYHLVDAVGPTDMYCHAWTPDGQRMLCGIGVDQPGIFSVRATDGGDAVRLTTNPFGSGDVAWSVSPDGRRFAFLRYRPGPAPGPQPFRPEAVGIFTARLDGSDVRQIVPYGLAQAHELASASWSPDGRSILSTTKSGRIFTVSADGGSLRQITLDDQERRDFAFEPAWSPDGRRIAFQMFRDGQPDLYITDLDGSHTVQVTDTPDFENGVAWTAAD
jgi:Tol biopolymer transport system component